MGRGLMLIVAGRAIRAIDAAIGRLLRKKLDPSE
jgi:hypothetical protein